MNKDRWMWIDWLIFSLRCSWYGTGLTYYYVYQERLGEFSYVSFALVVSLGFFLPLWYWRPGFRNPTLFAITELILTGGFSIYINNILKLDLSTSFILMPILMIGYLLTRKIAFWAIPTFVLLLPANRFWTQESLFEFFIQYIDVLIFFGIGLGFNLITNSQKRYKQLLDENVRQFDLIQQQNNALEQYAAKVEKLALVEERNRMARDLHDSIGHHFTSVTVGLDALTYMVEENPQLAKEKLTRLADVARDGLAEVRRTIHQIAPVEENLPLLVQLEDLIVEFAEHTNTKVEFVKEGLEQYLAPHVKLTLIRCLQEAMTNAKRHGEASYIRVRIEFTTNDVQLMIYNNGRRMATEKIGFGLSGMKYRLEELNGNLTMENVEPEGFQIMCTLPLRRVTHEEYKIIVGG